MRLRITGMTRFCHVCETRYQRRCHQCQSCFRVSDLSLWINASNTTWQQIWGRYCLVPQGSVVLCCSSSSFGSMWKHFGQQDTHVSDTRPRCHTCHQPYQNNFTGHKFLLRDNECAVSFSHYGSGTFGGEPGSINFQDGLNKGPWWRHLESYYLGLMNFWRRAVWFMIPNTRANVFLIYRPFTSTLLRPEIFWTSHFQFYLPLIFYAEWLFLSGIFDTV